MWQRLTNPDVLIYLDVSYPISCQRRNMDWNEAEYQVQVKRLEHARQHADYYLNTDELSIDQVLEHILNYLAKFS
jgi:cytidylate kinase